MDNDTRSIDGATASVRLLSLLCEAQWPLSLDDVVRELGLPLRQAQKILRVFEAEGFAIADHNTGLHLLGPRFLHLSRLAGSHQSMEHAIRPIMRELARATGETVTYNTYAPGSTHSVCVIVEESPAPLHYAVEVGEVKALHAGSSGRAILAHLTDEEVEDYIAKTGLPAFTARTITDPEKLRVELAKVREQGFAMSRGQRVDGAVAIAGSVFDAGGRIHASLVLTTPSYRFKAENQDRTAELVKQAARRLSGLVTTSDGH